MIIGLQASWSVNRADRVKIQHRPTLPSRTYGTVPRAIGREEADSADMYRNV